MGPLTRYSTTPLLLLALLAACGTEVAPEEQPPCDSRGTLIPGASRNGFLGEANCVFQSDISPGLATNRDRWSLLVHPDTVYVVSARYLVPAGGDRWTGRLLGYTPEGADTLLRTGFWGTSGALNGDLMHEMLLASTSTRTLIVHLERATTTDSGRYQLEVRRCPIFPLTPGESTPPLALDAGCLLWSAGAPGRARFFSYPSDSGVVRDVTVIPAATGVAIYYAWASRPPLNFACWYASGSCDLGAGGAAPFTIRPYPVAGITAGVVFSLGVPTTVVLRVDPAP